jgi:hypothetical protein
MATGAVIRELAVDTGLDEDPVGQLGLDRQEFIFEPPTRSGAGESLAVVLQDDPKVLAVKASVWSRVAEHQFNQQHAVQQPAVVTNGYAYPALDVA